MRVLYTLSLSLSLSLSLTLLPACCERVLEAWLGLASWLWLGSPFLSRSFQCIHSTRCELSAHLWTDLISHATLWRFVAAAAAAAAAAVSSKNSIYSIVLIHKSRFSSPTTDRLADQTIDRHDNLLFVCIRYITALFAVQVLYYTSSI